MSDTQHCGWCNTDESLTGLVGYANNCCPKCGNPIFPIPFGEVKTGAVFVDAGWGGKWCKIDATMAVCVEDDSSYQTGEVFEFDADDIVNPF